MRTLRSRAGLHTGEAWLIATLVVAALAVAASGDQVPLGTASHIRQGVDGKMWRPATVVGSLKGSTPKAAAAPVVDGEEHDRKEGFMEALTKDRHHTDNAIVKSPISAAETELSEYRVHINLDDYDLNVPPQPAPCNVKVMFRLLHLYRLDDDEGTAQMSIRIPKMWKDERLKYPKSLLSSGQRILSVSCDSIWTPVLETSNVKKWVTVENDCRVFPDGTVFQKSAYVTTIGIQFDPTFFPFDDFELDLAYEMSTFDANSVVLVLSSDWTPWYSEPIEDWFDYTQGKYLGESGSGGHMEVQHWEVAKVEGSVQIVKHASGDWSRFVAVIHLDRTSLYYWFAHYVPMMLVTYGSSATFFISPEAHSARISVFLGSTLSMIALNLVISDDIPKSAHLLWINVLLIGQYILISMTLMLSILAGRRWERENYEVISGISKAKDDVLESNKVIKKAMDESIEFTKSNFSWVLSWFPGRYSNAKSAAWWDMSAFLLFNVMFFVFHIGMFVWGRYVQDFFGTWRIH